MPAPGEMIGGRYRLDDRIAAGGMGEVWRATDTVLGRDVAVKTLHAGQAGDPGFQERFRHEARAMAALHHPGIADVYDYGQTGDGADAYIVMARVAGRPLNELIAARGRLGAAETMSIVAQAGRALDAAHQAGIVHRDVKPGNLIIRPDGTVVLVDFGVARSADSAALTGVREVVGTALYIAPEQVSKEPTGPPADMYALGVVAYHCLAGQPPFLGENPLAVAMQHVSDPPPPLPADVPAPVRALVMRAMAKDPAARYPTAAAMAEAADTALTGGPAATMAGGAGLAAIAFAPGVARFQEPPGTGGFQQAPGTGGFQDAPDTTPYQQAAGTTPYQQAAGTARYQEAAGTAPLNPRTMVGAPVPQTPGPRQSPSRRGLWIAAGLVLAGLATVGGVLLANQDKTPSGDTVTPPVTSAPAATKGGGEPAATSTHTRTKSTKSTRTPSSSPKPSATTKSTEPTTSTTPTTEPTTTAPPEATTTPAEPPATTTEPVANPT